MNEPYRLRYTNQIVGFFLLVLLLFMIVLSVLLLRVSDYFADQDHYWLQITQEQAKDIQQGTEVMILGQRAGMVEEMSYVGDGDLIRVNLSIDPERSDEIFRDSVVSHERKFGVGVPMLVIRRAIKNESGGGVTVNTPLKPGSQIINFQGDTNQLDQVATEVESVSDSVRTIQENLIPTLAQITIAANQLDRSLLNNVNPAFDQTRVAFDSFNRTNEELRPQTSETLDSIQAATKNLEARIIDLTERIGTLVDDDMRETLVDVRLATEEMNGAAETVSETAESVNNTSVMVGDDIAETLKTLRKAATQVQQLAIETQDLVKIVRKEANSLPGTTDRVNDTVSDTQELVGEIRGHWLLRRSGERSRTTPQLSPSGVRGGGVR